MPRGRPPKSAGEILLPKFVTTVDKTPQPPKKTSIRKLWELMRSYGLSSQDRLDRDVLESELEGVDVNVNEQKAPHFNDVWQIKEVVRPNGPIRLVDTETFWFAEVGQDGNVILKHHYPTNLMNRIPGRQYPDETLSAPSLESLVTRLSLLLKETDNIWDQLAEEQLKARGEVPDQPEGNTPSIHGANKRIEQLRLLAEEFGYVGANEIQLPKLPYKIAEALGMPTENELGYQKIG